MNIADVRGNKSPTITFNSPQSAEKESADKKSPDGSAGMKVDDVKRVEHSKDKVTAEAYVGNETGDEPKKNDSGVATIESKSGDKNNKGLQGDLSDSPTKKQFQNKGEKNLSRTLALRNLYLLLIMRPKARQRVLVLAHLRLMDPLLVFLKTKKAM